MAGGRRLQAPFGTAGFAAAVWIICAQVVSAQAPHPTDVSGLAWIAADSFLVVHDAKVPEELDWPRLSIVRLPDSAGGPIWHALEPAWPPNADPSHDLESIARIPGSNTFILLESGDDGTAYRRMFIGELENATLRIRPVDSWPGTQFNVEAAEVIRVGASFYFLFAERAHGERGTWLMWTPLTPSESKIGRWDEIGRIFLPTIDPSGPDARPVSALAVDSSGRIYIASTQDSEVDSGPFRSVVWRIGGIHRTDGDQLRVALSDPPERLASIDGFKVESLAIRELEPGRVELFIGMDDEAYGGTIRPLSLH